MNALWSDSSAPILVVVNRFRVPDEHAEQFAAEARLALDTLAQSEGFIDAILGQSTDEADLRLITTRWQGVGAYRRALSRFEVKIASVPLLSRAIDESSAFEAVHLISESGAQSSVSGRAADADAVGLGQAAAASVPPVQA